MKEKLKQRNIMKYLLIIAFTFLTLFNHSYKDAFASSASITFKSSKSEITKGDKFYVNLYLESETEIGDFTAFVTYNPEVLEFVADASFIAGGDGLLKITNNNVVEGSKSRKYVMTFIALEAGESKVELQEEPEIYDFESGMAMSVSTNTLHLKVTPVVTASTDSSLQSLRISGVELDEEFATDIYEYHTSVEASVDKLIISAIPTDSMSKIDITGNGELKSGENTITITVTSEAKTTSKYFIHVLKDEELKEDEAVMGEILENYIEVPSFMVKEVEDTIYISYGYEYEIIEKEETIEIPSGYVESSLRMGEFIATVYVKEGLESSEYALVYAKNQFGHKGFYQYDRIEQSLQRFNEEEIEEENILEELIVDNEPSENPILLVIVIVLGFLLSVATVLLVKLYLNKK